MKLTNDQINKAAAELLGLCWHDYSIVVSSSLNFKVKLKCARCGDERWRSHVVFNPDFTRDANAVRELVVWLKWQDNFGYSRKFKQFLENELDLFESLYALAETPKHITLAVLYAVGKITLEQARLAMEGDDE